MPYDSAHCTATTARPLMNHLLQWPRAAKRLFVVVLDACMGVLAMWLAFSLRLEMLHWPEGLQWPVYALAPALAFPIFVRFGLYRAIFRYTGITALITTGQAVALYGVLLLAILLVAQWEGVPRSVGILQPLILLLMVGSSRALGWLLLMTLWMPLLDFARSYAPQVSNVTRIIGLPHPECVEVYALNRGQITALQHHGNFTLQHAQPQAQCPWLVADESRTPRNTAIDAAQWTFVGKALRPADKNDNLLLYRRIKAPH